MSLPSPSPVPTRAGLRGALTALVAAALTLGGVAAAPAQAAVGDTQVAWLEVEDGAISGGPALNSGDHGNFSGSGSYTFRETGMTSTMTFTAPAAGTYPVWIRYAAGPLSAEENVTRGMGLLTNGGARQTVPYELTGSWEDWEFARADVTLVQGTNTLTLSCDRGVEMCRLNFDAIQVGGLAAGHLRAHRRARRQHPALRRHLRDLRPVAQGRRRWLRPPDRLLDPRLPRPRRDVEHHPAVRPLHARPRLAPR